MSSSSDDRSAAGSRSSVASIPLSEVASSPIPASLTNPASRSNCSGNGGSGGGGGSSSNGNNNIGQTGSTSTQHQVRNITSIYTLNFSQ